MIKKIFCLILILVVGLIIYFLYMLSKSPGLDTVLMAKNGIQILEWAIKTYKLDNGFYPTTEQGLAALIKKPTFEPLPSNWRMEGYLEDKKYLYDPWGNKYIYLCPGKNHEYEISSLGADKNKHGAFAARGVHGQTIYVDPTAEMVIARFASFPTAKNAQIDPTSLPAYQAVAEYLMRK